MAQINILAKFLSQALEWKVRFPKAQFFAGLRYEPFIYFWARRVFPDYSRLYPDNEEFIQKFVKDLRNKNQRLLKIINPEMVAPEQETINVQFETEAQLEQQQVAQITPQEVTQPFSLSQPPTPRLPSMPPASTIPREEEPSTMVSKTEQPQPTIQAPKIPSSLVRGVKNLTSRAGIFFQRNLGKYLTMGRIATVASGVIGGVVGAGLTGGAPLGIFAGAGGGVIGRFWVGGGGGGQFLGRVGNGAINAGVNISNQVSSGATRLSMSSGSKKLAWGLVGALIFFVIGAGLLGGITGTTPTGETAPVGPVGSADISSCKFTRGQENPKEASFKSNTLLGYIQEASQKSSIPTVILAAFIRVESPSSSNMSDEQVANYSANCAQSSTGALGIMQIQPPGTTSARGDPASCDDCIDAGAKLVDKTVSTMTREDYCDPRTNIVVGAGWILKKMSKLGYGDGTRWNPEWINNRAAIEALVNTYYGCLNYGGPQECTGPFNYADDVSESIQNCYVASGNVPPPPADGNHKKWLQEYGIALDDGFVPEVYKWAYEVLAPTPTIAPKFKTLLGTSPILVKPSCTISKTQGRVIYLRNRQEFCAGSSKDGPTATENLFKQVFAHELGHIINGSYRPGKYADQIKSIIAAEGYLTTYAKNAATANDEICGAGDLNTRASEDFAESISYFINRGIAEQDYGCGTNLNQNPIYAQADNRFLYLKHYQLMTDLLR